MSLVSEALRKARQEAAERGAARKGVVIRTTVMLPPRQRGLAPGAAAILGGLAVLLAVGAGVAWWALARAHGASTPPARGATRANAAGAAAAEAKTTTAKPGEPRPVTLAPKTEAAPAAGPAGESVASSAMTSPVQPASPRPVVAAGSSSVPVPEFAPGKPEEPDASAAGAAGSPTTTPNEVAQVKPPEPGREPGEHERSFRITAVVDGIKLSLDYIAYQPTKAFAGINGHEVLVGTSVEGFLVEEIGPDYVRLRDRHGPFFLRTN